MLLGIVFLSFSASYAGRNNSLSRNVKIAIGLTLIACGFKYLLHLNLPLI
jgi:dipeptide/tripeptide permease